MECMSQKKVGKKRGGNKFLSRFNMDMMFEAYLAHESGHLEHDKDEIPHTKEPVWILGKQYSAMHDSDSIRKDILTRLWFSYRKGFISIGESGLTSDKGWGCMLRCGQMLIAQALLFIHLGREWRWNVNCHDKNYLKILRMFEDRRTAPYSIHQIALTGASEGKQIGDWFGPNTVAQVLKKLSVFDKWSCLYVHVALDNCVIVNEIRTQCKFEGGKWRPLLLIIPLRLGINEINPVYINGLRICFTFPQSLGIIGGKPNHALYFIGVVGNDAIYLDPHTTQSIGVVESKQEEHEKKTDSSYHCQHASRLHFMEMDPSVAVGFLCQTEEEFNQLLSLFRQHLSAERQPLFEVRDERDWSPLVERAVDALQHPCNKPVAEVRAGSSRHFDDSDEDFELLG